MAVKNVTLGFESSSDTRQPRRVRLMIQDEDFAVDSLIILSEHDFVALLSGSNVKVEAEI